MAGQTKPQAGLTPEIAADPKTNPIFKTFRRVRCALAFTARMSIFICNPALPGCLSLCPRDVTIGISERVQIKYIPRRRQVECDRQVVRANSMTSQEGTSLLFSFRSLKPPFR